MPATSIEHRAGERHHALLAAVGSLALALAPIRSEAASPPAETDEPTPSPDPAPSEPESGESELTPEPEVTEVEPADVPSG
ncbi:MAG TPA: hypothetical protein VK034_05155, partial [Enhygromyxa sp.]|nr:hypothetical protein [Enhygromyxa sp.]